MDSENNLQQGLKEKLEELKCEGEPNGQNGHT